MSNIQARLDIVTELLKANIINYQMAQSLLILSDTYFIDNKVMCFAKNSIIFVCEYE